jgi:hypothetical protein
MYEEDPVQFARAVLLQRFPEAPYDGLAPISCSYLAGQETSATRFGAR